MDKKQLTKFYGTMYGNLMEKRIQQNKRIQESGGKEKTKKRSFSIREDKQNFYDWAQSPKISMNQTPQLSSQLQSKLSLKSSRFNLNYSGLYKRARKPNVRQSLEINDFCVGSEWTELVKDNIPLKQESMATRVSESNQFKAKENMRRVTKKTTQFQKNQKIKFYLRNFQQGNVTNAKKKNQSNIYQNSKIDEESERQILENEVSFDKTWVNSKSVSNFSNKNQKPRIKNKSQWTVKQYEDSREFLKFKMQSYFQRKNRYALYL